jgi:hypothetical protein
VVLALIFASSLLLINPIGGVPSSSYMNLRTFIERPLIGCFLWLASFFVVGGGAAICWWLSRGLEAPRSDTAASVARAV